MKRVRPKTSLCLVLLMAWAAVWCCCQSAAMAAVAPAPAMNSSAACCERSSADAAAIGLTCLPTEDGSKPCPFLQTRNTTWLQQVAVPDLQPQFAAILPVAFAYPLVRQTANEPLPACPAHGPPDTPLSRGVQLLC